MGINALKLGLEIVPDQAVHTLLDQSRIAEAMGFRHIWLSDHFCNRDVFEVATVIALGTSKIIVGPGVTNPYTRNPMMIASAAATLHEISGGRCALGIGAGDRITLKSLGLQWKQPVHTVKKAVTAIRHVLEHGKTATNTGDDGFKVNFNPCSIPIYVGGQGSIMLRTAGQIADGVLVNSSQPKALSRAINLIQEGARSIGRDMGKIDIAAYTIFSINKDADAAVKYAKPVVAYIIGSSGQLEYESYSISPSILKRIRELVEQGKLKDAAEYVRDEMVEALAIAGTPDYCLNVIEQLGKLGVTQVVLGSPLGKNRNEALELIRKEIMPYQAKEP